MRKLNLNNRTVVIKYYKGNKNMKYYPFMFLMILCSFVYGQKPFISFEEDEDIVFNTVNCDAKHNGDTVSDGQSSLKLFSFSPNASVMISAGKKMDWRSCEQLYFDIFVESSNNVALTPVIETRNDGHIPFEEMKLNSGWNKNVTFNAGKFRPYRDYSEIKSLKFNFKAFPDCIVYMDNFRWGKFPKQFSKIEYLETRKDLDPTDEEKKNGFIVFKTNYMEHVFKNKLPKQRLDAINLFAAGNEQEPVLINIHALNDINNATVDIANLYGPKGSVIPASKWSLKMIRHLDKREQYTGETYISQIPMYLTEANPFGYNIGQNTNLSFWLTLSVDKDCKPGIYSSNFTIRASSGRMQMPVTIRILPFELPEVQDLFYGEYYIGASETILNKKQIYQDLTEMKSQGMTSVGLWFTVDQSSYKVNGTEVSFDFKGDTQFEWFMDSYKELGFPMPIITGHDPGKIFGSKLFQWYSTEFDEFYINFHQALAGVIKEKGWPQIYVQPFDEPSWHGLEERKKNLHLLKLLQENGIKSEIDGPCDAYMSEQAGKYADMWTCSSVYIPFDKVQEAISKGKLVTIYNYDTAALVPEAARWATGFFNWAYNLNGAYNWAYRHAYGSSYNDFDSEHGDLVHYFSSESKRSGGPAISWEATREGIDDRRYLVLLESELKKAKAEKSAEKELISSIDNDLEMLRQKIGKFLNAGSSLAKWDQRFSRQQAIEEGYNVSGSLADGFVAGNLKMQNTFSLNEYNNVRWMLAKNIMKLKGKAAEKKSKNKQDELELLVLSRQEAEVLNNRLNISIPDLDKHPEIDGMIESEKTWNQAKVIRLQKDSGLGEPAMETEVRCGVANNVLYISAICEEEKIKYITANVKKNNGPVFTDDCIEVFISPQHEDFYYQVIVNANGAVMKLRSDEKLWESEIKSEGKIDIKNQRWVVEVAIPLDDIPIKGQFRFNVCRARRPLDVYELYAWSPTNGNFSSTDKFGLANIGDNSIEQDEIECELKLSKQIGYVLPEDSHFVFDAETVIPPHLKRSAHLDISIKENENWRKIKRLESLSAKMCLAMPITGIPEGKHIVQFSMFVPGHKEIVRKLTFIKLPSPFMNDN